MSTSKNTKVSLAKQLIAGTQKHFGTASSLAFASATFTPAQVTTSLQTIVDLRSAVDAAKASTKVKVSTEAEQAPALDALTAAYIAFVRATFAKSPDVLADFGLKPKKTSTPLTVEEQAAAVAKRASTRAARSTMGTVQKKKVKGDVTSVTITSNHASQPVVSPATPAPHVAAPST